MSHHVIELLGILLQVRFLCVDGAEHAAGGLLHYLVGRQRSRVGSRCRGVGSGGEARQREDEGREEQAEFTHHFLPGAAALEKNWPMSFSSTIAGVVYCIVLPFLRKLSEPPGSMPIYCSPSRPEVRMV